MNEFIQSTSETLGMPEPACRQLTIGLLSCLQMRATSADSAAIQALFPQTKNPPQTGSKSAQAAGAGMGAMLQKAGAVLGAASSESIVPRLYRDAGLSEEKSTSYSALFVRFIESKLGKAAADRIIEKVPELRSARG